MLKYLQTAPVDQKHLGRKCALYDLPHVGTCWILTEATQLHEEGQNKLEKKLKYSGIWALPCAAGVCVQLFFSEMYTIEDKAVEISFLEMLCSLAF